MLVLPCTGLVKSLQSIALFLESYDLNETMERKNWAWIICVPSFLADDDINN